ncbi:MAG: putative membrane protein, partial [Marivirga sp.]
LSLIFKLVFNIISPLSTLLSQNAESPTILTNILALLSLLLFIFIFGFLVRNRTGQLHFSRFETRYLLQVPLYASIKETVAQFTGIEEMPFSQVVLVDIYNTGILVTGFVTESLDNEIYTTFVPTVPNPMNGDIYHVPVQQLRFLTIEPEKAMKSKVGMGMGSSHLFKATSK